MYDVHTHFIPPDVVRWLRDHRESVNARWLRKDPKKADFLSINGNWEFELKEAFINPQLYLEEQESQGVLHSLVSPIPQLFLYEVEPEMTRELAFVYNDSLAEWIKQYPSRLSALATLPMNNPEAAASELERAMDQGLQGAIIATSWQGRQLTEERFGKPPTGEKQLYSFIPCLVQILG